MSIKLNNLRKIVSTVVVICLIILSIYSLANHPVIDIYYIFNMVICFLFALFSVKCGWHNTEQTGELVNKKKSWTYFLLFVAVFISVVEIFMFYEELVLDGRGIASSISAIASYTLFDSVHKYLFGNE
ncbi:MAG: hypothetical protein J6I66_04490 [Lachnospiraceae bacterium]|nr:hypothetical protein [Lachnospiraceae bacterium]